jgi:hypothetical protein
MRRASAASSPAPACPATSSTCGALRTRAEAGVVTRYRCPLRAQTSRRSHEFDVDDRPSLVSRVADQKELPDA